MNDEDTLPPHQPNTLGNVLKRAWALAKAYPDVSIPAGVLIGFLAGVIF